LRQANELSLPHLLVHHCCQTNKPHLIVYFVNLNSLVFPSIVLV
uniref:Ovule protein n=1 Tax=Brugia timori TaxID=42155 RepID=A0A0R3RAC4_9BILA